LKELDNLTFAVDSIYTKYGNTYFSPSPKIQTPSVKSPPRNYFPPGMSAGDTHIKSESKRA